LTIGYVLFFLIHIIQVIIAGWNNFQAMVTGFEVVRIKEEPIAEPLVVQELPKKEEPIAEPLVVQEPPIKELPTEESTTREFVIQEEPLK
jgi:hypothetical protein